MANVMPDLQLPSLVQSVNALLTSLDFQPVAPV